MRSLKFDFEVRRHTLILKRGYNEIRLANWFILCYMDILQKQTSYFMNILLKYFQIYLP